MSDARDVQQVLARYVRATDRRDASAMSALFMDEGRVEIFQGQSDPVALGALQGAETIGQATAGMMAPHPARGWSHHTTHDSIIEIEGDEATIDAQFIVYNTVGLEQPVNGWPQGSVGAQGRVDAIEAGYYHSTLKRVAGHWKIAVHRITLDLPHAFPGA